ncbi:YgiW/YdeI family stress tolerance OB fold protein [Aggregatibacter actinomycetemcomitans]|uniref:YgiW/YdeI family stress tolerance OB fold protein n=1 Tax=Aggregatibacter actinomycetemcomitans TaxID=714 RepID=UPI0011D5DEE0|nr:NirD/YgiW/YdeI family stress tolerance protein [Aggregatibacter actinomycetemcomitans]QEH45762.1 NirD/YgiW/YdeI family stress tolerance protein [Aggregatibacter actinomycetemcomitans]QEH47479.1 NirD/YgiW/YdeI family stress tolerance protein [Aggregatibacter actinomycetemcomitans]QEH49307.1 NirD/YgiW/YdeI family stress tolerance protein [Aggregatibacter actinomycetemcomitans]TYA49950.1 NirD/YgiW/YdeI family stress tolerance protein [Aggregatibacter actinomycetemcomitans]TYA51523.1 NirD/YgiW/
MKKRSLATIFVLSTIAATGVFAQGGFQDPNAPKMEHHKKGDFKRGGFVNIDQAVNKASEAGSWQDDQYIILQGNIVKQVGKDDFIFKDASGEIQVEIERKAWRGQDISPSDEVKLYGEVDKSWNKTEVDIDRVEKIVK